jgi:translation initiation factor 1
MIFSIKLFLRNSYPTLLNYQQYNNTCFIYTETGAKCKMDNISSRLVYSSEKGKMCPSCEKPINDCICREIANKTIPSGTGIARILYETKGRKGKGVTVISGIPLSPDDLKDLGRRLKQKCGSGGTVKNGTIEIQGDHRPLLKALLEKEGFEVQ